MTALLCFFLILSVSRFKSKSRLEARERGALTSTELPGERATISDWANHISTIFPEMRLKCYLKMRGADGGPWRRLPALPAYWAGILYDDDSLDAAWDLVKNWNAEERQRLRDDVPKLGFAATIAGYNVLHLAKTTVALAEKGLARRRRLDRRQP